MCMHRHKQELRLVYEFIMRYEFFKRISVYTYDRSVLSVVLLCQMRNAYLPALHCTTTVRLPTVHHYSTNSSVHRNL
jgi:hypothetical protein